MRIRENTDQKKLRIWTILTQWMFQDISCFFEIKQDIIKTLENYFHRFFNSLSMNIIKPSEFTTVISKKLCEKERLKLPRTKDLIFSKGGEKSTLREQCPYLEFF